MHPPCQFLFINLHLNIIGISTHCCFTDPISGLKRDELVSLGKVQSRYQPQETTTLPTRKPKKSKIKTRKMTVKHSKRQAQNFSEEQNEEKFKTIDYRTNKLMANGLYDEYNLRTHEAVLNGRSYDTTKTNGHAKQIPFANANGDCKPRRSQSLRIPKSSKQPVHFLPKISMPSTSSQSKSSMNYHRNFIKNT